MKIPFQFSIRELFLLTLAIGAILALARTYWKQSQQIQGTELSDQHFISRDVDKIVKQMGLTRHIVRSDGGGGHSDFTRRMRSEKCSFDLPVEYHAETVRKLRESIEDKIASGGCRIKGRMLSSGGYEWTYSRDTLDGIAELMIITESGSENRLHIMFLVIESSKPKQR